MRRALPSFALLIVLALVPAVNPAASAQTAATPDCPISVQIVSVLAANTNEGMDARLMPISHQLESMFHYTTYRLVSSQQGHTSCGHMVFFELPGGRILHVEPRGIEDGMIAMELTLFQGSRLMIATQVKLNNHGVLMVGGPHYQEGMLITSIRAQSPALSDKPQPVSSAPASAKK